MQKLNTEVPIKISGNSRLGDIRHNYADIFKSYKILGYQPQWSFEEDITEFVKWVNLQEVQVDTYESSISELKSRGLFK
jgi:dTDP-L-rhamnose 4-epimerase